MRLQRFAWLVLVMALVSLLAACGGGAQPPVSAGGESGGGAPAPATPEPAVAEDVPVLDGAFELVVRENGNYISYQADVPFEEAAQYYDTELAALGWERINKKDSGFGDSITLLRKKPDKRISVTVQGVGGSGSTVRVLISVTLR